MKATGWRAVLSDELFMDVITWASSTEISTDNTRANASLDTMLSTTGSFLWIILIIFNIMINKVMETVIQIT